MSDDQNMTAILTPVPPEAPLAMPVQDFATAPKVRRPRGHDCWRVWLARVIAFGGTAAIAVVGLLQMFAAFGDKPTPMQMALLVLFVPTFAWVGFPSVHCSPDCLHRASRRRRGAMMHRSRSSCRSITKMPPRASAYWGHLRPTWRGRE